MNYHLLLIKPILRRNIPPLLSSFFSSHFQSSPTQIPKKPSKSSRPSNSANKHRIPSWDSYFNEAKKLGMEGKAEEMNGFLKKLITQKHMESEDGFIDLIDCLCKNDKLEEALIALQVMHSSNCSPSLIAHKMLLRAFVERCDFRRFLFVYKEMVKARIGAAVDTLNLLIDVLCKTGKVDLAIDQYRRMGRKGCAPDSRSYEILIGALCRQGRVDEGIGILNEMQLVECELCSGLFMELIPLFCEIDMVEKGMMLLSLMKSRGLRPDSVIYHVLVNRLCRSDRTDDARELFDEMVELDIEPNVLTFVDLVTGYCKEGKFGEALGVLEVNYVSEAAPYDVLLECFCENGQFLDGLDFLNMMIERGVADSSSWNTFVRGLCSKGHVAKALEVFDRMIVSAYEPEEVTSGLLVNGFCKSGRHVEAVYSFRRMVEKGWSLDSVTSALLIRTLCGVKNIEDAVDIYQHTAKKGCPLDTSTFNSLIRGLCSSGKVLEAVELRSLASHLGTASDSTTFCVILDGFRDLKIAGKNALSLVSQMLVEGIAFDSSVYSGLLHHLCDLRMELDAVTLFKHMSGFGLLPETESLNVFLTFLVQRSHLHLIVSALYKTILENGFSDPLSYNVVIRGLCREGYKEEARTVLDQMIEMGWVPDASTHSCFVTKPKTKEIDSFSISVDGVTEYDSINSILREGLQKQYSLA